MASLLPSPLVLALPAKSLSRWFQLLHPTRHRGSAPPSWFLSCCSSRVPNKASTGNKRPQIHLSLTWALKSGHGGSSCSTENHPKPSGSWHRASLAGEPRQLCETRGTVKKSGLKNNQKIPLGKITGFIFTCMPGAMGHLTGSDHRRSFEMKTFRTVLRSKTSPRKGQISQTSPTSQHPNTVTDAAVDPTDRGPVLPS